MTEIETSPVKALFVITERNVAPKVVEILNSNGIIFHAAAPGKGTAPSGIMSYLGLGERVKSIIMSLVNSEKAKIILNELKAKLNFEKPNTGVAFTINVGSLCSKFEAEYLTGIIDGKEEK